jgi:homoserine O-acetyltransferase
MGDVSQDKFNYLPDFQKMPYLRFLQVATPDNPLELTKGGVLEEVDVAYETYGSLSPEKDNAILLCHALTGDSHPAAHYAEDREGWWEDLVGPGQLLDTERFFIICPNVLGGCRGATGPASPNPVTGKPYGASFPVVTIRDMVHVQKRLLERLGIQKLVMVVGGSMGGMQALEWATTYPDMAAGVAVIAAPGYTTAQAIAYNDVGRRAIQLDPEYRGGDYYGGPGPVQGLTVARAVGMITYQSEESMTRKFSRRSRDGRFEIENYLDYQGECLVKRFDANSYLCLTKAIDLFDLKDGRPSYQAALAGVKAKMMIVGVSSDILYPVHQQRQLSVELARQGARVVVFREIESIHGHDGFLIDFPLLADVLGPFIESVTIKSRPWYQKRFSATRMAYYGAVEPSDREFSSLDRTGAFP